MRNSIYFQSQWGESCWRLPGGISAVPWCRWDAGRAECPGVDSNWKIPQENNLKRDHRKKRFSFALSSKSKINDFYGHQTTNLSLPQGVYGQYDRTVIQGQRNSKNAWKLGMKSGPFFKSTLAEISVTTYKRMNQICECPANDISSLYYSSLYFCLSDKDN